MLLKVTDLEVAYGPAPALWGVTLGVRQGELLSVVGPNSAGKSTLINTLAGLLRARAGTIELEGRDITQLPAHRFCAAGIALVPEGRRLFATMSVLENLELGSLLPHARAQRAAGLEHAMALFPVLAQKLKAPAGSLSGGQQQMVAIARALMARPKLLLLDEPSMGLAPIFVEKIFEIIHEINEQGTTILLVEQNALMALDSADRGYVLETGRVALADDANALRENEQVRKAYLGED
jgi:branched-chain amino acid transport system ATP-binding protein